MTAISHLVSYTYNSYTSTQLQVQVQLHLSTLMTALLTPTLMTRHVHGSLGLSQRETSLTLSL